MFLYCTQEELQSINSDIPSTAYLPFMAEMATRARAILHPKSDVEIYQAALELYYSMEVILRDMDHEQAFLDVLEGREQDEYTTASRLVGPVRALKNYLLENFGDTGTMIWFRLQDGGDVLWHPAELFAVLALVLLVNSKRSYETLVTEILPTLAPTAQAELESIMETRGEVELRLRGAARYALRAMDAVNHAETLNREYLQATTAQKARSEAAEKLNGAKHAKTYEAEKRVIAEWMANRSNFRSATKAGNHFSTWLAQEGLKVHEPSTVTAWIRKHAKAAGIRLR